MKLLSVFGIGSHKILAKGTSVKGTVTAVHRSVLHVEKKPVRLLPNEKNTRYSHFITFSYIVDTVSYQGRLFVDLRCRCPQKGETIEVFYDPDKPQNYACYAFEPKTSPIGW